MVYKKLLSLWLPVVVWCAAIFYLSSKPTIQASYFDVVDFIIKKSAHLIEYSVLYFLLFRAINNTKVSMKNKNICLGLRYRGENLKVWLLPLIFLIIYAISDEYHQSFIPGRTATVRDILIDISGGFMTYYLAIKKILVFF